jgi:hypothetical protein
MPFVEFPFWASPGRFLSISAARFAADSALVCVLKLLLCGDHLAVQLQQPQRRPPDIPSDAITASCAP